MASLLENASPSVQVQNNELPLPSPRTRDAEGGQGVIQAAAARHQQQLPALPGQQQQQHQPTRQESDPFIGGSTREGSAASGHRQFLSVPAIDTEQRGGPQIQPSIHDSPASIEVRYNENLGEREAAYSTPIRSGNGTRNSANSGQAPNLHFEDSRQADGNFDNEQQQRGRTRDSDSNGGQRDNSGAPLPSLPPLSARGEGLGLPIRQRTIDTRPSRRPSLTRRQSAIDWIVPTANSSEPKPTNLAQRLQPTLDVAIAEKDKYALKAKWTGWTLNAAIGLQVLLGSLTTGLSAVATSGGKSTAVSTTILGALATLVASYLARARGSNEPELSITRVKDLEQFIRECEAFKMDHGHITGPDLDHELEEKRRRFEELLGNANGERKLSPPV